MKKKLLSCLCVVAMACSLFSTTAFAGKDSASASNAEMEVVATEPQSTEEMRSLYIDTAETAPIDTIENLNEITPDFSKEAEGISPNATLKRDIWAINDPVFVGNGTLDEQFDIYVVTLNQTQLSFLKLNSSNSNLMAVLYEVKSDGTLGGSYNWGAVANSGAAYINIPAGRYALVIGSGTGTERGTYNLMWNCSTPQGAKSIIYTKQDLSMVYVYANNGAVYANGVDIIKGLEWEEHETWYTPNGHSGRDMAMKVFGVKGIYKGNFSSSLPYSAPNALLVDVSYGSWMCHNSYYSNVGGSIVHVQDYFDLSGLKTPRTFGEGAYDFSYGPNYIVINLDTNEVCEFLSPFNINFTPDGGRTYSLTSLVSY